MHKNAHARRRPSTRSVPWPPSQSMESTLTNKYPSYRRSGLWSYLNPTPLHSTTIISRVIAATIADPYTKMTVEPRAFDWCVVLLCSEQWFARKWPLNGITRTFDADGITEHRTCIWRALWSLTLHYLSGRCGRCRQLPAVQRSSGVYPFFGRKCDQTRCLGFKICDFAICDLKFEDEGSRCIIYR
jgi:hypothetical protein